MHRLNRTLQTLSRVAPRRSLFRCYATEATPPIAERAGVPVKNVNAATPEQTETVVTPKESVGVPEEPVIVQKVEIVPPKIEEEIPRVDVTQKVVVPEKPQEQKKEESNENNEQKPKKPLSWRAFMIAMLGSVVVIGSGYYSLHWQIIDVNADLIRDANKLQAIKTQEQKDLEALVAREKEEEDLMRRRRIARDLKRQEEERQFLNRTKQDILRKWNNVWSALGFAIQNTNEEIKRKEEEKINSRIYDEVQASYGVSRGNAVIKHIEIVDHKL
jgi:hypothetical protein